MPAVNHLSTGGERRAGRADTVLPGGLKTGIAVQLCVLALAAMPLTAGGTAEQVNVTAAGGVLSVASEPLDLARLTPGSFADWDR